MKEILLELNSDEISKKIPLHTKVYIWSILFESLLFFIIGSQTTTGVSMTVGKILQFVVFFLFLLRILLNKGTFRIVNFWHPYYRYFTYFFILSVLAAIIGVFNGAYTLETKYSTEYADSIFASIIRSSSFRPFVEYLIVIYYFIYFIILPRFMIETPRALAYFFNFFKKAYILCLGLGFLDIVLQLGNIYILPRDMWEGRMVGFRFHGLAGEPRDAFVYIFYGFAVLNLREYWLQGKLLSSKWFWVLIVAALLTQSGSGLVGIVFGVVIYLLNVLGRFTFRKLLILLGVLILSLGVIALSIYSSQRLQDYVDTFSTLYDILESEQPIPLLIAPQMVNVFPIWDLYQKIIHGNIIPILIGSGYGSASVVNNNLGKGLWNELTNPHSQLIRLFFECGIFGTYYFIKSILHPIKYMIEDMPNSTKQFFLLITIAILGLNLSHRSTSIYIYLGVFIATYSIMQKFKSQGIKK
ncbi:hypothetical protein [Aquirufa aurantiipilula]|uniref:O-antigen ligase domain-containing protein n=1 Tax=Aquirufa aurantiipilula TaxID=2696561 RepID=A0ABT6BK66_9BACT|nr:hypothetical protein [Aquirufa aurantiipilula]MDF5690847.1 hypothetical protein [Aquirufa aurantiipilula]